MITFRQPTALDVPVLTSLERTLFPEYPWSQAQFKEEIAGFLFNIEITVEPSSHEVSGAGLEAKPLPATGLQYTAADESGVKTTGEVSRNAPCPCGSGKKYKRCHGAA